MGHQEADAHPPDATGMSDHLCCWSHPCNECAIGRAFLALVAVWCAALSLVNLAIMWLCIKAWTWYTLWKLAR